MNNIGDVVCAIIEKDEHFLIAQRPSGHPLEHKWEFPGGKVNAGESEVEAITREILEELALDVNILSRLTPHSHTYEHVSLTLIPFVCTISKGTPQPLEHNTIAWVNCDSIGSYDLAEADIPILNEYLAQRRC